MVNLIMRLLGLGKAVDALDGASSKAYLGGVGQILAGAAAVLGGLGNIVVEIVPLHGGAAYFDFARNLSHDPNMAAILAGVGLVHLGIAAIGNRHAMAKINNAIEAQGQVPEPPPQDNSQPQGHQ